MKFSQVRVSQKGFAAYIAILAVVAVFVSILSILQLRRPTVSPNNLTASLVGSGGVTISSPDNNSTLASPVHVTAYVAAGFTGPVRTMQVFADNALVYQVAGTSVDTSLTLSAGATHNITVEALKKNSQLEGAATVYVTVSLPTPTPPSSTSVPALPPVPSP